MGNPRRSFTLTAKSRARFDALLAQNGITPREFAIVRRTASRPSSCSFAQQRLWFLDRLTPGQGFYNVPAALRLGDPLDAVCLERCVNELARRHETLRTTFREIDGEPTQVIAAHQHLNVEVTDLLAIPAGQREAEVMRLATEEARRPFDLEHGPLLRVGLLRVSEREQVLLVTMHHIVSDGWSADVLFRELAALYEAFQRGEASPLPELPVQYADYAAWQREWLRGEVLEEQLRYWKKQLEGLSALPVPADHARPVLASYQGSREFLRIDEATTAALKRLSEQEDATLFITLLAVFQALLYRYTGQADIAVGTLTAGRNRVETEGLIGFFVNTLVLRTDVGGNPSFRELVRRVKETALGAYGHSELPFEKLVEEMHPERDLSRNPLVQLTFQLFSAGGRSDGAGWRVRVLDIDRRVATFDLALDLWETNAALSGFMEYSTDLFEAATVKQMLRHFETLATAAAENPDEAIERLPILSEAETHRQVVEWNQTAGAYPCGMCVHELFEAQAAENPGAPAIAGGGEELTYDLLNRRANRMAHSLIRSGAGPGSVIGICAERSVDTVAAVLGVLKAGAAYLPLDPAWPEERRNFMAQDAGALLVISSEWLAGAGHWGAESNPAAGAGPRDLAYVLYTSGSTGRPKGVMVEHGALVNHAFACGERFGLTQSDRVLQFASLGFDVAAEEIFPTWAAGGCVVLSPDPAPLPSRLAGEAAGVTVMNLPAPYWHEWVDSLEPGNLLPEGLRLVITGSDRVDETRVARWLEIAGGRVRLMNAYGATEATITSLTFEVTEDTWPVRRALPVGRPLGNVSAYILDPHLNPAPAGVEGDLYLGGAAIARGYTNHDERSFVDSPYGSGRLYRTGDRARAMRDGNIVFVGRGDDQMKVRGFRVEPSEIEAALREIPGVKDAAAALDENSRLAAWVSADRPLAPAETMAMLRSRLPEYMIPFAVMQVPALPRTVGGKLDRSRLPQPQVGDGATPRAYAEPATDKERLVSGIWCEALGLERAGIDESFFDLGGHSLLLLRVHSRLEAALGRDIPIVELFRYPTIRSLSRFLTDAQPAPAMAVSAAARGRLQKEAAERRKAQHPQR
jgi:amino acid adenylation domain-containing protein